MSFFDIKENEIDVKYGMYNLCEEREGARGSLRYILSDFADIKKTYFNLGFHLDEFVRCRYYKDFGYVTFKEFALENIPLDYSAVNRCLNVFNMICKRSDGNCGVKSMFIKDEYKDYSYSQLVEMVTMDDQQRKQIKPTMSVRQIRNIKSAKVSSSAPVPSAPEDNNVITHNCDVAIDDDFLAIEMVDMLKKKYKGADFMQLSHTARCIWFKHAGKQYKIMLTISDIKE